MLSISLCSTVLTDPDSGLQGGSGSTKDQPSHFINEETEAGEGTGLAPNASHLAWRLELDEVCSPRPRGSARARAAVGGTQLRSRRAGDAHAGVTFHTRLFARSSEVAPPDAGTSHMQEST